MVKWHDGGVNWKHASQVNLKHIIDQDLLILLWELKILNDWYFFFFTFFFQLLVSKEEYAVVTEIYCKYRIRPNYRTSQSAFYVYLYRAVIGPSGQLTGRWRPDVDLRRMLAGILL